MNLTRSREARICAEMAKRADLEVPSIAVDAPYDGTSQLPDLLALRRFRRQVRRLLMQLSA